MIALLLALVAADPPVPSPSIDGLPIAGLPTQSLPAEGCAAYLFSAGKTRALVAMATASPPTLRLAMDGKPADYARASATGDAGYGFAATSAYQGTDVTVTLDLAITTRKDIVRGAVIETGTLRVDRPGKDTIVMPLGGLIGCAG